MDNKRGGAGAIVILVLILMLASAVGGAYGYRVLDGKLAVKDAQKAVADVDISDYDTPEQTIIQGYIDDAGKDLAKAKTRKQVYEILGDFISDVDKVQTKKEKELEEALKAAEEAKKQNLPILSEHAEKLKYGMIGFFVSVTNDGEDLEALNNELKNYKGSEPDSSTTGATTTAE